jgi:hypothetical protein
MWSIVHGSILLVLVALIPPSCSLKTIQAVLTHTVELPCSARQSNKSINPAKVNARAVPRRGGERTAGELPPLGRRRRSRTTIPLLSA